MTLKFSFVPAPTPEQTPTHRARQVFSTAAITPATGNVMLPEITALNLVGIVNKLNERERGAVKVHGTAQELARVAIVSMSVHGVGYNAERGLSFAPDADLVRFFSRVLPAEETEQPAKTTAERPAELDEALAHLKKAGEALLPLVKREGKELFGEVKTLLRSF